MAKSVQKRALVKLIRQQLCHAGLRSGISCLC